MKGVKRSKEPEAGNNTSKHYCERLAAILLLAGYDTTFRNALTPDEAAMVAAKTDPMHKSTTWELLTNCLLFSPRLQSIAASCTSYTPSVWLLEQELMARKSENELPANLSGWKPGQMCQATAGDIYKLAETVNSSGLCFSGGGIRSATFNLGVLQGLAELELFDCFDYLSSVSGGGYIHQFLAAWLYNRNCLFDTTSATPIQAPQEGLNETCRPPNIADASTLAATSRADSQSSSATATNRSPLKEVQHQLRPLPWTAVEKPVKDQKTTPEQNGSAKPKAAMTEQPEPIRWLRRYSNYLTPRKGLFTADTWVLVAIWLRNTFLNQLALLALLGTFLLIPHLLLSAINRSVFKYWYQWPIQAHQHLGYLFPSIAILLLGTISCFLIVKALGSAKEGRSIEDEVLFRDKQSPSAKKEADVDESGPARWMWLVGSLSLVALTFAPAVYKSSLALSDVTCCPKTENGKVAHCGVNGRLTDPPKSRAMELPTTNRPHFFEEILLKSSTGRQIDLSLNRYSYRLWLDPCAPGFVSEMSFLLFTFAFCMCSGFASLDVHPGYGKFWSTVGSVVGTLAAWIALYLVREGTFALALWKPRQALNIAFVTLPVSVFIALFLALVLTAGVVGRRTDDSLREAMARLRAISFLYSFIWIGFTGFSLLGPLVTKSLIGFSKAHSHWRSWAAIFTWVGGTLGGVVAGHSDKTAGKGDDSGLVMKVLVKAGPPIFIVGVLLLLSDALKKMAHTVGGFDGIGAVAVFVLFLLTALLFGFRLDINDFSMHAFYRDRLARCYVGASYPRRRPNRFTGFAQSDGRIRVSELVPEAFRQRQPAGIDDAQFKPRESPGSCLRPYPGPFPIFCTTVNLTFGQDLAWQERKGASFAFTPLYSGYSPGWTSEYRVTTDNELHSYNGFVPTYGYAYEGGGIPMHSAAAISGAAVSPNWGYHTDPAMAFLLTMFNVRLGWWIKNPRVTSCRPIFNSPSPIFPLWNLFNELLGRTTDMSHYVYLTDGGHFDNMGLYELVRRRCRRILICDAEQDGASVFEGVGSSIRKCRVDFGVEVDLDLGKLDPTKASRDSVIKIPTALVHFVTGTIRYPESEEEGTILYVKATITGDEPGDVLNYRRQHDEFPNESTLDQWFTESQFESYRRLGYHCILDDVRSSPSQADTTMGQAEPLRQILCNVFPALDKIRSSPQAGTNPSVQS